MAKECACACACGIIIISVVFLSAYLLVRQSYLYPFPNLTVTSASVTSLNTLPATFNLTLKVSKVGFMADDIIYDEFNVSLLFNSNHVGQVDLGSGCQAKHKEMVIHSQFIITTENITENATGKMVEDQKKGSVVFEVEVSTTVRFKRHEDDKKTVTYVSELKMVFNENYNGGEVGLLYAPVDFVGLPF